jgi:hypothetical protein
MRKVAAEQFGFLAQPAGPIPKMKRPPEKLSRLPICLARIIGLCSGTRQMPVASFSFLVAAAAMLSATN